MSVLQAEVFEAFRSIDVPEDKAIKAATALSSALTKVETDVEAIRWDLAGLKADLGAVKLDIVGIKGELALLKWMLGFVLATNVALLFRVFSH